MTATRKYWIGFSRAAGIGAVRLRTLLDRFGDIETAWHADEGDLREAGIPQHAVGGLLEARRTLHLDGELERVERAGFDLLTWEDPEFPPHLLEIASGEQFWSQAAHRNFFAVEFDRLVLGALGCGQAQCF